MKGFLVLIISALFFIIMINFALKILIIGSAMVVFITLCLSFSKSKCKIMIIPLIVVFFSVFALSFGQDESEYYNNIMTSIITSEENDIAISFNKDRIMLDSYYIPNANMRPITIEFMNDKEYQKVMGIIYVSKDNPIRKIIIPNNSGDYGALIRIVSSDEYIIRLIKENQTKIIFRMDRKF